MITIDQSKCDPAYFPKPLSWWRQFIPVWMDAAEVDGKITLIPNGAIPGGGREELTRAVIRRLDGAMGKILDSSEHTAGSWVAEMPPIPPKCAGCGHAERNHLNGGLCLVRSCKLCLFYRAAQTGGTE